MLIPIRCWSCGKPIAHLWEEFGKRVKDGEDAKKVLDSLRIKKYCCRALFIGHSDLIDLVARYKKD